LSSRPKRARPEGKGTRSGETCCSRVRPIIHRMQVKCTESIRMGAYETVYNDSYSSSDTLSVGILSEPPFGRSEGLSLHEPFRPPSPPKTKLHPTL